MASRGDIQAEDTVLILGCGPAALTILQVAKMIGAKCIMCDIADGRIKRAEEFGADVVINSRTENLIEKVMKLQTALGLMLQ